VLEIQAYRLVREEESIRCAAPPTLCVIVVALRSSSPFRIYIYRNVTHSQNVLYPLESPVTTLHLWGDGDWGAGTVVVAATELITVFMGNNSAVTQVACFANTNGVLFLMKLE